MSKILDCSAEVEIYFRDNWVDTTVHYEGQKFDHTGLDKWISISYEPILNTLVGLNGTPTGRIEHNGMTIIGCYHKTKNLALKLADDVSAFLNGKELPLNVIVGIAQPKRPLDLNNGFWEVRLNFDVKQDTV